MANKEFYTEFFRASYVHLSQPQAMNDKTDPKYSITMLFPKSGVMPAHISQQPARVDGIFQALNEVCQQEWGVDYATAIASYGIQHPPSYKDGDQDFVKNEQGIITQEVKPTSQGMHIVTAKSAMPVGVADHTGMDCDAGVVYSGSWCRAKLEASAYKNKSNQFVIALRLMTVQKAYDDEQIGGAPRQISGSQAFGNMAITDSNCQTSGYQQVPQTPPAAAAPPAPAQAPVPGVPAQAPVPGVPAQAPAAATPPTGVPGVPAQAPAAQAPANMPGGQYLQPQGVPGVPAQAPAAATPPTGVPGVPAGQPPIPQ